MPALDLDGHGLVAGRTAQPIPEGPQHCAAVLDRALRDGPDGEALVGRSGRYTYRELDAAVGRAAAALRALGVEPGDRVAATLPNDTDIVIAFLAAMRVGAIWVGISAALAAPEQDYIRRDCEVGLHLGHHVELEEWRARCAAATPEPGRADPDPHAPAAIAYTSGTTGFPKGAVHSHHNLMLIGAATRLARTYDPSLRQGVCLPLTVLNLMVLGPLTTFQLGAALVAIDRVDPVGLAGWIERERVQTFSAVPAIVHGLLTHPEVRAEQLATLTRPGVGGADLPESFRSMYRDRFGAEVTIGYGLTEAPTAVTVTDPSAPPVPGEAGRALPQVEIVIVDDHDAEVPAGTVGEVCVRAARDGLLAGCYTPMLGYWNQPEATRSALRGGMLHTGDLGLLDAEGRLFIKDRRNDLIIRGGSNVYPAEVERVLHASPEVAACAVIGYPDERLGERVAAFVEWQRPDPHGDAARLEALRALCATELAAYKVPDRWHVVDHFERTAMGKIRKTQLRSLLGPAQ